MQRLSTEFDNTEELATVLIEDATSLTEQGDLVELYDGDGNHCFGIVVVVGDGLIYVRPCWK